MNISLRGELRLASLASLVSLMSLVSLVSVTLISSAWSQATPQRAPQAVTQTGARVDTQAGAQAIGDALDTKTLDTKASAEPTTPPPPPPKAKLSCAEPRVKLGAPFVCTVSVTHQSSMSVNVRLPLGGTAVGEQQTRPQSGDASQALPTSQSNPVSRAKTRAETRAEINSELITELITERSFSVIHDHPRKPLRIKGVSVNWRALGGHEGIVRVPPAKFELQLMLEGVRSPETRDFKAPLGGALSSRLQKGEAPTPELSEARATFWARHAPPSLRIYNWPLAILLGALIVISLGALIGWQLKLMAERRARDAAPYVDPRPAHVIAYEALRQLEWARLIEAGAYKAYSLRISEIMRAYFGKRYSFMGLEMTSDELRAALSDQGLDTEAELLLNDFLSDTDLIKFADFSSSAQGLEEMGRRAHRLIEITRERDYEAETQAETQVEAQAETQIEAQRGPEPRDDSRYKPQTTTSTVDEAHEESAP